MTIDIKHRSFTGTPGYRVANIHRHLEKAIHEASLRQEILRAHIDTTRFSINVPLAGNLDGIHTPRPRCEVFKIICCCD